MTMMTRPTTSPTTSSGSIIRGGFYVPNNNNNRPPCTVKMLPLQSSFFSHGAAALKASGLRITTHSHKFQCRAYGWGHPGSGLNFFGRITRIIMSYANAILSYFEDPEKIIEQAVVEMNNDLVKMRQATAQIMASHKQLDAKYLSAQKASEHWYKRAQLALQKGDETFAREALKRRKDYAENQRLIGSQCDQMKGIVDSLTARTQLVESKIREAKAKKDALKARSLTAKTATTLRDMMENVNGKSALAAFERMEEKVMMLEFEAESTTQMIKDDLDTKFAALEGPSFDDELANLKREMSINTKVGGSAGKPFQITEMGLELEEQLVG